MNKEAYYQGYKKGYQQAILDGKTIYSRSQGKWKHNVAFHLTCSVCNCSVRYAEHVFLDDTGYYYCPNCGAYMKGEEE